VPKRSAKPKLGRLEKLDPTDYWQTQADFQQWLTDDETLELLNEATGLALIWPEPEASDPENYVLLVDNASDTASDTASRSGSESAVLVAACLDAPQMADLGQLLAWVAAETEAIATVVWVAPTFSAEMSLTLDWLDQTSEVTFLGMAVELWHIGKTAMAANFVPVCGAVDDSERVEPAASKEAGIAEAAEAEAPPEPEPEPEPEPLTELQQENLDFWSGLCDRMDRQGTLVKPGSPAIEATMGFAIARAGFRLNAILDRDHNSLYTELLLSGIDAQPHFHLLAQEREAIADEVGLPLIWDGAGDEACMVACTWAEIDLSNRDRWPDYQAWFCDCLERFYEAFFDRIKRVDAAAYQPLPRSRRDTFSEALILPGQSRG
jgi:hypothetical protein